MIQEDATIKIRASPSKDEIGILRERNCVPAGNRRYFRQQKFILLTEETAETVETAEAEPFAEAEEEAAADTEEEKEEKGANVFDVAAETVKKEEKKD